jgi:predicted DsbA family dithiol-disulfide isomerase
MQSKLDVFIHATCPICREAHRLADRVRKELPEMRVSIIDLTSTQTAIPAHVFAVPAFVLNGTMISLGNPSEDQLMEKLKTVMEEERWDE